MPQELDGFRPFHKTEDIYKQYLHYSYLLGCLPKHTDYKPTSPYLKEDLRKLDELSQQVRYMSKYGIETFDDLYADREKIQRNMDALHYPPHRCKTGYAVPYLPKKGNTAAGKGRRDRSDHRLCESS